MNIDKMQAGREMDVLVAEHVFGWRKIQGPKTDYDGPCESFDVLVPPTIDNPFPLYPPRGSIKPWWFCDNWSTDIAAAWEVFEEFLDPNRTSLHPWGNGQTGLWWAIYYDDEMIASAKTAPLAICRAALKTVMGRYND